MVTIDDLLKEHLCEFDDGETCERCKADIPPGQPIYFFSDGGYDCREGTYVCGKCASTTLELCLPQAQRLAETRAKLDAAVAARMNSNRVQ